MTDRGVEEGVAPELDGSGVRVGGGVARERGDGFSRRFHDGKFTNKGAETGAGACGVVGVVRPEAGRGWGRRRRPPGRPGSAGEAGALG